MKSILRFLLLACCSAPVFAGPSLFSPSPTARQSADATTNSQLEAITQRRTVKQATIVDINLEALAAPSVDIALPSKDPSKAVRRKIKRRGAQDFSWFGELSNIAGDATLVVRKGRVTGTIRHGKALYRIRPLANGQHVLLELDEAAFPPEDEESSSASKHGLNSDEAIDARLDAARADATADGQTIDLLVAYTSAAQNASGDIDGLIQLAIDETNQGYQNSGVIPRVRLVHTHKVTYTEGSRSFGTILDHLEDTNDGRMDEVHALRDQYGADAVLMVINQDDLCGTASTIMANAATAFAVVNWDCATGYYSFGHELGHLQGARHDPATDGTNTPFRYGHGYRHLSQWRTVLAYDCNNDCPRVNHYSNPNVLYNGNPTGTADRSHNARVLNETAATVAAFRELAPPVAGASLEKYIGPACSGGGCPGWQPLDIGRTAAIAAAQSNLYQATIDGNVYAYTGTPCSGNVCNGWQMLDNAGNAEMLSATGSRLYQLRDNGELMRYTGTPCSGSVCSGWQRIDIKPNIVQLAVNGGKLYEMLSDGSVYRYNGTPCSGTTCNGWKKLANAGTTKSITVGSNLYRLDADSNILRYTGTQCSGGVCSGWEMIDNNATSMHIVAANAELYQSRGNGEILRYTGTPCSAGVCSGWELIGHHTGTGANAISELVASGTKLYMRLVNGTVLRYGGTPCSGGSCPAWRMLDNDTDTEAIGAASSNLYQIRN